MKKLTLTLLLMIWAAVGAYSEKNPKTPATAVDSTEMLIEQVEKSLVYQTGEVTIGDNLAKIKIPVGFRFLDAKQAQTVIYDLWGNPKNNEDKLYGLIVPEKISVAAPNSWAFVIQYDDMGFVKDDDADKINYDDLLKEMQEGEATENAERTKAGYPAVHLVGWAQKPYYDKNKKVLHWAKEIAFGGEAEHTLNYNVRVLGRKGVLVLNAVGGMGNLPEITQNIDGVLNSVEFNQGNKYSDFDPSVDKVAAWTVGGLVAGKVLAKAGLFAVLAKFGKVIILAIVGGASALWRFITGKKKEDEPVEEEVA